MTAAAAQARLTGTGTGANGSFAQYYSESSYGKYTVSPNSMVWPTTVPYTFTTNCDNPDTSRMATAVDAVLPAGMFNHVIMYFTRTNVCAFGGLGEEGSSVRPSKHTWMNGSLTCVVLMQEPGHNIGLMHANQIKCGTSSFSATPSTACTITEYANSMSTMGSGCKTLSGYERMYEQWMNGCNAVKVPGSGTFNLMPLESPCGGGIQTLQVPFPAVLPVSDPQAGANTVVNLRNYYLDLRVAGGTFDAYGAARGQGAGITFTAPTVFIYTSDDVRNPTTTTRNGTTSVTQQSSVWTELLNTTPTGTTFTGLTAAGQSFVDPAGGPTITLMSISAAGAVVQVTNPMNTNPPTCLDGTTPPTSGAAMGSTSCGPVTTSDGGIVGTGGAPGTGGASGGMGGRGMGGTAGGTGGMTGARARRRHRPPARAARPPPAPRVDRHRRQRRPDRCGRFGDRRGRQQGPQRRPRRGRHRRLQLQRPVRRRASVGQPLRHDCRRPAAPSATRPPLGDAASRASRKRRGASAPRRFAFRTHRCSTPCRQR